MENNEDRGYFSGYKEPKNLSRQIDCLRNAFPGLGLPNQHLCYKIGAGDVMYHDEAEGWFAIPNWAKNPNIFGFSYNTALQKMLDTIKLNQNGKFYNFRDGFIGDNLLKQYAETEKVFERLAASQGNPDILLLPAQFGLLHKNHSAEQVREICASSKDEFCLDAFTVCAMLLTHPKRLQSPDDLGVICAGDEYSLDTSENDDVYSGSTFFEFFNGKIQLDVYWIGTIKKIYAPATGFFFKFCN